MEDDQGDLLVLDQPYCNEYYEYAVKERILENMVWNGENVSQQLNLVSSRSGDFVEMSSGEYIGGSNIIHSEDVESAGKNLAQVVQQWEESDSEIVEEWLLWMKEKHIPKVLETKLFVSATINRIISNSDSGSTYAIAYKSKSLADLQKYETLFATDLRNEYNLKYSNTAPTFRTIMEIEKEF